MSYIHWDTSSMVFYLILAFWGMWCMSHLIKDPHPFSFRGYLSNRWIWIWVAVWGVFAATRLLHNAVGGTDASLYANFFERCNSSYYDYWMEHAADDVVFKWINKIVRFFTNEYRIYFFLVYGFMTYASIAFAKRFSRSEFNIAPYLLVFYLYLRSYNTLRSNLAIAFILIGLIYFADYKIYKAYIWTFASGLVHKASLLYALCLIFIHIFQKRQLTVKIVVAMIVISSMVGLVFQQWFIQYTQKVDLKGSYGSYAKKSLESNFFDGF